MEDKEFGGGEGAHVAISSSLISLSGNSKAKRAARVLRALSELFDAMADLVDDDAPVVAGLHKGTFTNKTGEQAKDLHVVFDKEGVTFDPESSRTKMVAHDPVSKDGKTEIDLDGDINTGGSAFRQVFRRKDGEFKVEKWWWTTKVDGKSSKLGGEHLGAPGSEDTGDGAWE